MVLSKHYILIKNMYYLKVISYKLLSVKSLNRTQMISDKVMSMMEFLAKDFLKRPAHR